MLLLNADPWTDFWHYWPTILFTGLMCFASLLMLIFWFIERREDALRDKAQAPTSNAPTTPLEPRKKFWRRFLEWTGIKKKKTSDKEVEEYKEKYSTFKRIGLLLIISILLYFLFTTDLTVSTNTSDWVKNIFGNIWFWIGLVLLIIIIVLIVSRKKIPGVKPAWKWLWNILGLLAIVWIGWIIWSVVSPLSYNREKHLDQTTYSPSSQRQAVAEPPEKYFDLDEENHMKKGESNRLVFRQYDGALLRFAPKKPGTIVYTITKAEDETRTWDVEVTRCPNGKIVENRLTHPEPYDAAKRGVSYISVKSDASVVLVK